MKTFEEFKERITPEFIKKLCELAEGFEYTDYYPHYNFIKEYVPLENMYIMFPLLLHRAVEGYGNMEIDYMLKRIYNSGNFYMFKEYQPCHLTTCEMAILYCLIEVLK